MKVAEIFAELGFKVQGADELKAFETSLQNIANAARNAALALKILSRTPVPKGLTTLATPKTPAPGTGVPTVVVTPATPGGVPYGPPAPPPVLTPAGPPPVSNSVLQGLKSLGAMGAKVLGIATVAIALKKLVSALTEMVKASMAATFAVDKFTSITGMSRRELKEWERVAALSDVKAEELQDTMKRLQQQSRNIRWTGEGATPFLQMGINAMASPSEIMKQFAKRTKDMDTATAVYFGGLIGLSDNMVYMLRKNADKLDQLLPKGELAEEEHTSVMELNKAWKDLTFTLGLLRDRLVADIAPALKWVVDQMTLMSKVLTISKPMREWAAVGGPFNPAGIIVPLMKAYASPSNSTKVENNVKVEVTGSDRPKETARETAGAIRRELSDSYYGRPPPYAVQ